MCFFARFGGKTSTNSAAGQNSEPQKVHAHDALTNAYIQCHRVASTPELATNFIDYKQMAGMTTVRKSCY